MPVLTYEGPPLEQEQRNELIKRLTEAACEVVPNIPKQAYYVFLKEYPMERVGVGGLVLPEYLKRMEQERSR